MKTRRHATFLRTGAAIAAVLALVVAGGAAARPGGRDHHGPPDLEQRLSRLELSAEAERAVHAILDEARPEQRALRRELKEARRAMKVLLDGETVDAERVMAQVDVIGGLKTAARKLELRTLIEVREHLTPDQRERLEKRRRHRGKDRR